MRLRTTLSRHLRRFARQEDGAMALAMAGLFPLMLFMLTLVEASRVYAVKNQLQATADAAAMASVWEVPDGPWLPTATEFARYNMPLDGQYGDVLSNVETGHWNGASFCLDGAPDCPDDTNAVRVTTSGEMRLFFAAALRSLGVGAPDSFTPEARATALLRLDKCYTNGFVAGGMVDMNSSNTFTGGFCVYGRSGVTMNNSNEFAAGTGVGMLNLGDLTEGGNNPGLQDALVQKDIAGPPMGRAQQLIEDFMAGIGPIPDYITTTEWVTDANNFPDDPVAGTMYIYTGADEITVGAIENVAIVSEQASIAIKTQQNEVLRSVLLASAKSVDISSNVHIGDEDYCETGEGASLIISGGAVTDKKEVSVETNSNISLHGVQIVAEGTMEMNSNLVITGASVQATDDIVFNSSFKVAGCPDESPNVTRNGTMVAQLVD